ncbi:MAG: hypothetical protein KAI66_12410 [Lentisphaeria bacterium]|nr:hypothetical protein [Lentisphaeria bacterium]
MTLQTVSDVQSKDLGNGVLDHGVATPVSNHRGTVATVDGDGNPVVLSWLMDHRGGYCLLMLDLTTGEAEQYPTPWQGDSPFASILSSDNRYYTHCGNWFVEFDPVKREMTFVKETTPRMAMSMTEDDEGRIWSATYPQSGVACYDPKTGVFRDYGHVYKQDWLQYPRAVAADDTGWVYLGIGTTAAQIVMLDPESGEATAVIPEEQRSHGAAVVERQKNGKVYGWHEELCWELYEGKATAIEKPEKLDPIEYIASSQSLFHEHAPSGDQLVALDLVNRQVTVKTKAGETRVLPFDYTSEGAHIMGVATASNGTACGGTAFPMRFFSFDPKLDAWTHHVAHGQWNTVAGTDESFFVGGYGGGFLLEWDPSRDWIDTEVGKEDSNPRFLHQAAPTINRPHNLLAHPDGQHVILAGTPGYGLTGGGLMFWDRKTRKATIREHTDLLEWHSTNALLPLPDGKILGGTTISPGTGGAQKATEAELYILDLKTEKIEWHQPLMKDANHYTDLFMAPTGLALGFADCTRFFVFDPATRSIVHENDLSGTLGSTTSSQGPRVFVQSPDGRLFVLFAKGIARLDPITYEFEMLVETPVSISAGGAWLDNHIYFAHASHLYSWQVPSAK